MNKKVFIITLFAAAVYSSLLSFPVDDGLRHVGKAFTQDFISWGTVYPYSSFEDLADYNPWYGYDKLLSVIASFLKQIPLAETALKFILVKVLSFIFLSFFLYLVISRSGILAGVKTKDKIKNKELFVVALIIMLIMLYLPCQRILSIRPFIFGTFFILYSIDQKKFFPGIFSSVALSFLYPYLSWFYTIPVAFAHLIRGSKKFAGGVLLATITFLYLQPPSFWKFQTALFSSGKIRSLLDDKISELASTWHSLLFYLFLVGFAVIYPKFRARAKKMHYRNLLIIIYLVPSLKYLRYFIDLMLPLLFISFSKEILYIMLEPFQRLITDWKNILKNSFCKLSFKKQKKSLLKTHEDREKTAGISLMPYIIIAYAFITAMFVYQNYEKFSALKKFKADLSAVPIGSLVLTDFGLQYKMLFVRPDLHIIPSCEIGFPKKEIKEAYIDYQNNGKLIALACKTRAKFLVEQKKKYINPEAGRYLKPVKKSNDLKVWEIICP